MNGDKLLWLAAALCISLSGGGALLAEETKEMTIELLWGRGGVSDWSGTLEVQGGEVLEVNGPLLDKDEYVKKVSSKRAEWKSGTAGVVDSVHVKLRVAADASIVWSTEQGEGSFTIEELYTGPYHWKQAGKHGGLFVARRLRSDVIGIVDHPDSYVFKAGKTWNFVWTVDAALSGKVDAVSYAMWLVNDGNGEIVKRWPERLVTKADGRLATGERLVMPNAEGVYSLHIKAHKKGKYLPALRVQFVVLDPVSDVSEEITHRPLVLVDKVDIETDTGRSRFIDDGTSSVVSSKTGVYRISGTVAERTSRRQEDGKTMNWFAYRLRVKNPGRPHLLKIDYPDDVRRRFVASLIEPVPSGMTRNIMDIGIATEGRNNKNEKPIKTKNIVFWPTTNEPTIVFVNTLQAASSAVAGIEVFEATEEGLPVAPVSAQRQGDLRGVYFEDPHMRMLGGERSLDHDEDMGRSRRSDWLSWYKTYSNLISAMKYHGYNSVMMPVHGYGATLYPSEILPNNERYDDGAHFSDNRNPVQKDLVRLLLDLSEKEGLTVIPVFAFYTKIPRLENVLASSSMKNGSVNLLNNEGRSSRSVVRIRDSAQIGPYYDPLNEDVQEVVKDVIAEFSTRYADSPALGDIAIQLNTTGWSQYPGMSWGYNHDVLDQFLSETGLMLPTGWSGDSTIGEKSKMIQKLYFAEWRGWRNERMSRFYASVADVIRLRAGGRRLVLSYMNALTSRHAEDDYIKVLEGDVSPRELAANKGIDPIVLGKDPGIRIWRPLRTPVPYYEHSVRRSQVSYHPDTVALFEEAGADGIVEFMDYYETKVYDINQNYWFPVDYRMVATIPPPHKVMPPTEGPSAWFVGGWQIPQ